MFGCFFGHSFGRVETDGFQYCNKCGEAHKPASPHPCANGHIWLTEETQEYLLRRSNPFHAQKEGKQIQYFQSCSRCGEKREITIGETP